MTHWRHGHHPGALFGIECFISEEIGAIYLPGLEKVLYGTLWEYCALRQFYEQTYNPMQVSYYLKMYLQHPLLIERLTKVGFRDIVSDVVYRDGFSDALDETQTKTHRILRVQKEDVSFLLEKNATMAMLKKYQPYVAINLCSRKALFQWKIDNKVAEIPTDVFRYMTAEKFMRYMEAQFPIYCETRPLNRYRDLTIGTLVTTYVDYLHMCRRQAYDMKDKSVLFPKNCAAAHDREAERIQKINDAEGTIPVLLVAHMDTVHRQPVEQICYSADGAVAMSPQGIGGDDRCGVWMILQILRTTNCHVLFCEDEEVGCIGAKKFTGGSLRPQVNYIVELDRQGNNDAVFYRCDNPEFEDFVTSFGFETAGGSCSDISYIAPYLETAAVNISCGYYCEHQRHEYIHLETNY